MHSSRLIKYSFNYQGNLTVQPIGKRNTFISCCLQEEYLRNYNEKFKFSVVHRYRNNIIYSYEYACDIDFAEESHYSQTQCFLFVLQELNDYRDTVEFGTSSFLGNIQEYSFRFLENKY